MTNINLQALQVRLGGLTPADATVQLQCWAGDGPVVRVSGADVILPALETVRLAAGVPAAPIDYPPTLGACCVKITVRAGAFSLERFVAVPEAGPVDFDDLVDVDPATFAPSLANITAWQAWRDTAEVLSAAAAAAAASAHDDALATGQDRVAVAQFATVVGEDANRAGLSAFSAGQSATAAQSSEDDARGFRDAAEGFKTAAEAARDASLAGQFLGSALTSANDLNAITTPGVYRCPSGAFATAANNYPAVGVAGVLTVTQWGGVGQVVQRYTPYPSTGSPNIIIGEWIRAYRGSAFSAWRFMASQRINNPAGQPGVEPFTFDDTSNRELALTPASIELGTVDLNAVTLAGSYRQRTPAEATAARNYPIANVRVVLEVIPIESNLIEQRLTIVQGHASAMRGHYVRRNNYGTWEGWTFFASQRVDQTAGRAIYTWDDVNGREQLIWGDTGWRDISSLIVNGWAGQAYIRRNTGVVSLKLEAIDPSARTASNVLALPAGFRGGTGSNDRFLLFNAPANAAVSAFRGGVTPTTLDIVAPTTNTGFLYGSVFSYPTNDAWPTVLPGAAVGSVPNA